MMEQFDCRPLGESDLEVVAGLNAAASPWSWSREQFAQSLSAGHLCRVCEWRREAAGRPVGVVIVQRVLDEASILNVAVDPRWQSQGIGRRLLNEVLDHCRHEGVRRVLLEVRASNRRARQLYESLGFSRDGCRRGYYPGNDEREDALLYSLALKQDTEQ